MLAVQKKINAHRLHVQGNQLVEICEASSGQKGSDSEQVSDYTIAYKAVLHATYMAMQLWAV